MRRQFGSLDHRPDWVELEAQVLRRFGPFGACKFVGQRKCRRLRTACRSHGTSAALVRLCEQGKRLIVVQCEAANQTAAHTERVKVAVLAGDGRSPAFQVAPRPFHAAAVPDAVYGFGAAVRALDGRREVRWREHLVDIAVRDSDQERVSYFRL